MTQLDLAKKINLSKANVSKYEANLVEPNLETLSLMSDLFDVSVDYLLGLTEDKLSTPIGSEYKSTDEDLKFALFGDIEIDDEVMTEVKDYARFVAERKKKQKPE